MLALVAVVAVAGAAGTLVVAAVTGMPGDGVRHLALYLAPAVAATVLAMAIARPLLARTSFRQRFLAVGAVAAVTILANLLVLSQAMFVDQHDATLLAILFVYSIGVGVGAALVLARATSEAVERLAETARALGDGDLDARVGKLDAGAELDTFAQTLDDMAKRLQAAVARERQVEATRRDLMTAVSHDLRTPLASLRAMIEAIDEGVVDDVPSMRRYAGEMRRSITELVAMVDDLFELSQLDAGAIEAETEQARLADVVHSAVATVRLQAEEKGLQLEISFNNTEDVHCSPRLTHALQNLLVNAVRHTPADGTIRIDARRAHGGLEVAVADTGEGIPAEDLAHVFDPFFRGDRARSGVGSGLGLALAKRIVEALGGSIAAHSRPAEGARFALQIPLT